MGLHVAPLAIEVIDLWVKVKDFSILRGINLRVPAGAIFGLLGPNGAGKTTTLKVLLGKLRPTSGQVQVLGEIPWQGSPKWRARLGWMGEAPGHYGRLSTRSNLTFFGDLFAVKPKRIQELLERFQLWEKRDVVAGSLSKGQRQKLALARALLAEPEILFLDEPTSGMDVESARVLRGYVRDWAAQGRTVVLTTHDMEEAEELCHSVAFVEQGEIIREGTPEALCREVLEQEYIKRSERPSLERVYLSLRGQDSSPPSRE